MQICIFSKSEERLITKKAFERKFKAVETGRDKAEPSVVGDFDAWLTAKIEAATLGLKTS